MEITTKEELFKVITDLQGQVVTMQETIDKLSPIEDEPDPDPDPEPDSEENLSDEEVSEIDQLLQES